VKPLSPQQKALLAKAGALGCPVEWSEVFTARSLVRLGLGTLTDHGKPKIGESRSRPRWHFRGDNYVHHIDGNPHNNALENLRVVSMRENH
jgi:hypothetical protein